MKKPFNNIKVVIIEDDQVIRNGYQFLIGGTEGYFVSNSYSSVEEALKNIVNDFPDVILLDIDLPGINGIEGIQLLKKVVPSSPKFGIACRRDVVSPKTSENRRMIF